MCNSTLIDRVFEINSRIASWRYKCTSNLILYMALHNNAMRHRHFIYWYIDKRQTNKFAFLTRSGREVCNSQTKETMCYHDSGLFIGNRKFWESLWSEKPYTLAITRTSFQHWQLCYSCISQVVGVIVNMLERGTGTLFYHWRYVLQQYMHLYTLWFKEHWAVSIYLLVLRSRILIVESQSSSKSMHKYS